MKISRGDVLTRFEEALWHSKAMQWTLERCLDEYSTENDESNKNAILNAAYHANDELKKSLPEIMQAFENVETIIRQKRN